MKKIKLVLISSGLGLILLICLQVFSAGKGHVAVVQDNISLNTELTTVKSENKHLKKQVTTLTTQVTALKQTINPEPEIAEVEPEVKPEPKIEEKQPEKQVLPKKPKIKNEKTSINNPNNGSSFSINAISDPEGN